MGDSTESLAGATGAAGGDWTDRLVRAAEKHSEAYADDDREQIVTDVLNAFYAGAAWALKDSRAERNSIDPERSVK